MPERKVKDPPVPSKKVTKPEVKAAIAKVTNEVELKTVDSAENEYHVQADQWAKWDKSQRSRFNEVYSAMRMSPSLFTHPDAVHIPSEQWTTIAWNAAWVAAGA